MRSPPKTHRGSEFLGSRRVQCRPDLARSRIRRALPVFVLALVSLADCALERGPDERPLADGQRKEGGPPDA